MIALALAGAACTRTPSSDELDRLRAEAQAENRKLAAVADADTVSRPPESLSEWKLGVSGATGSVAVLDGTALDAMATGEVVTISPHRPPYPTTPVRFRTTLRHSHNRLAAVTWL